MDVFLARQPIFDNKQNVYAYEILYRQGYMNGFAGAEPDEASSKVIVDTFLTFGITNLTNGKPAFINFTGNLIKKEIATLFPCDFLVVEILETVNPDSDLIKRCATLKRMGYTIALDDFVLRDDYGDLIKLVDIIKIDFLNTGKDEIKNIIKKLGKSDIKFLAEKVETHKDFKYAEKLGFSLFQGFFFNKPEIISTSSFSPLKSNYLQLINKVNQPILNFNEIAQIISQDLSLTYNLLKIVNSAAFALRRRINLVKEALVLLGERETKKWVNLLVLNGIGEEEGKPDEIVRTSLIRARFAELLAQKTVLKNRADEFFLCGLFSMADVILNKPLAMILDEIKVTAEIKDALINKRGQLKDICQLIFSYEKGQWEDIIFYADLLGISYQDVIDTYVNTLQWYDEVFQLE